MVDMLIADPMGSMMKGLQMAAAFQGQQNSNALAGYRTREAGRGELWNNALSAYGRGAFAGDPNALAALYNVDPQKAWELQGDITDRRRKDVEWGRLNEEYNATQEERQRDEAFRSTVGELVPGVLAGEGVTITEELAKLNPQGALELARVASEIAANKSKAELEAETADMERILKGASVFYANKDQEGYNAFLQENADKLTEWGRSPADFPFQNFPAYAAEFGAVTEFLRTEIDRSSGPEFAQITGEEARARGLDPSKVYNVGRDGKITSIGGGDTNVTVNSGSEYGTIPQGYMLMDDPDSPGGKRMVPIRGGPEDTSQFDAAAEESKRTSTNLVLDEIDIARQLILGESGSSPATGISGSLTSVIDSTRAGKLKNRLETIKANIGFDKLQAMRDASPTGGALGQVSEFENRLLQAVFGSLEQAQSAEDILYNLGRIEEIYGRIINEGIPPEEARELYRTEVLGEAPNSAPDAPDVPVERIQSMDVLEINDLFENGGIDTLTPEQRQALRKRLRELSAGNDG